MKGVWECVWRVYCSKRCDGVLLLSPTLVLLFKAMSAVKSEPNIYIAVRFTYVLRHWSLDEWPVELLGKGSMDPIVYALWTHTCTTT